MVVSRTVWSILKQIQHTLLIQCPPFILTLLNLCAKNVDKKDLCVQMFESLAQKYIQTLKNIVN